ncbi:ABC transporter ATP-binding protein [Lichenihabitans sp. PAMC28606]|uniref:ABC transporter ATP-binding protein n=1 Tax=Lichenihabitans sp. PAMC28606 TaxID=2880932 RepID=UPI001D0BA7B3|nr:ABC transporter ATP-binding protein [Lichenihabitans sp. PAMC28606]UDL94049.1 ABC transporter ATP-binding protein [Lichenihabitans sp. PAMC28606]
MSIAARNVRWIVSGKIIVDDVTLDVAPGSMLGLVGPNGSGKSSLLRLICRLRKVASGVITLGEIDVTALSHNAIARRVALVEQQATTDAQVTVLDVVRLGRTPHRGPLSPMTDIDRAAIEAALVHVDMDGRRNQPWTTLSGGERQRVQIARALAQTPTELLLDEPTNHLDVQHQLDILSLVADLPATSIVALHDLNLAAMFCDTIVVLKGGRVMCAGTPDAIITADMIRDVFGVEAHVEPSAHHGKPLVQFARPARLRDRGVAFDDSSL